jgi:hypothetical protein
MSGVAPNCSVWHRTVRCSYRTKGSNGRPPQTPMGMLTWHTPDSEQYLSGAPPDCPVCPSTAKQPTARKWLEAINTPQPPPSMASKFSELHIHCKSKKISLQDTFQRSNPLQVSKSTQSLSDLRESVLCSFVALVA